MKPLLAVTSLVVALILPATAAAESVDHYQGEDSRNMEEALANLGEYNRKLEKILDKDEITSADMEKVHQLTYTLEKALARINNDLTDVAATLEQLHLNSERRDREAVNRHGHDYLEGTRLLTD